MRERGEPKHPEVVKLIREMMARDVETLTNEFGKFDAFDLVDDEVELVGEDGLHFRCYTVQDGPNIMNRRLVIDDYWPDEGDIELDEDTGAPLDPESQAVKDLEAEMAAEPDLDDLDE